MTEAKQTKIWHVALGTATLLCWLVFTPVFEFIRANPDFSFFFAFGRQEALYLLLFGGIAPLAVAVGIFAVSRRFNLDKHFVRLLLSVAVVVGGSEAFSHFDGRYPFTTIILALLPVLCACLILTWRKGYDVMACLALGAPILLPLTAYTFAGEARISEVPGDSKDVEAPGTAPVTPATRDIYVILLDGSDITSTFLDDSHRLRDDLLPNMRRVFDRDFVWFPNAWSNGVKTSLSVPTIFSGKLLPSPPHTKMQQEPTIFSMLVGQYPVKGFFRGGHDGFCHQHKASCAPFKKSKLSLAGVKVLGRVFLHLATFKQFAVGFEPGQFFEMEDDASQFLKFLREVGDSREPGGLYFVHLLERSLVKMRNFDRLFGLFIDMLEKKERYKDATIFLVSDHGIDWSQPCHYGEQCTPNSRILKVPLAIKRPGVGLGMVDEYPAQNIDIAPTLMALATAETDRGHVQFDGVDLFKQRPNRPLLYNGGRRPQLENFQDTPDGQRGYVP